MAKKSSGKTYVSKGERKCQSGKITSAIKRDVLPMDKVINRQSAWLKGQNPWITIDNPNKEQTNQKFIKVKANVLWGSPKERMKKMYNMGGNS